LQNFAITEDLLFSIQFLILKIGFFSKLAKPKKQKLNSFAMPDSTMLVIAKKIKINKIKGLKIKDKLK